MKVLFIGRFQPFHQGHLNIIKNASKKYDEIIIGIGSSQYSHQPENPFTKEERKKMIAETLKENRIKNYKIISLPDIHNPPKWVDHVKSIQTDFDAVLTNNELNKKLFSEKGYQIIETQIYNRSKFSGKEIRKRILNNKKWSHLVPKPVEKIINQINVKERIENTK